MAREYNSKWSKEWRDNRKALGICRDCRNPVGPESTVRCTECNNKNRERSQSYASRNPRLRSEQYRASAYGITIDEVRRYLTDPKCAICGVVPKKVCIDHCHTNGHVRGILCHSCNVSLGLMRDSPELLRAAAEYLEGQGRP